jgi:phage tail sheath protein FI
MAMPITPTYPGLYVEEILSNSRTISAAPTSVTLFVGYTHPFKTRPAHEGAAVEIFSFTEYEREFGGLFSVDWLADDVGRAVYQFFANGGSHAWVVPLKARLHDIATNASTDLAPPTLRIGTNPTAILFTGREPVDGAHALTVSITNPRAGDTPGTNDLADITVSYGSQSETFRGVTLDPTPSTENAGNTLEARIGTVANPISTLVTVSPDTAYPTAWPPAIASIPLASNLPTAPFTTFEASEFGDAFEPDGALDKIPIFNLMLTPGVWDNAVTSAALALVERKRAFFVMDPPADAVADKAGLPLPMIGDIMSDQVNGMTIPKSQNGALYFPYLRTADLVSGGQILAPPSGFVAGVIARSDTNRGVWKAPAGYEALVRNTLGVAASGRMTDPRHGTLNPLGVNVLRGFPGIGTVVFGARTLVAANPAFQQYRYVPVRRTALFLEQSLVGSLGWVIFEPNDVPLWTSIRTTIESFMLGLFSEGAFQGSTPSQAFQVVCDETTTTPDDQANGIVNIVVAFAPLKPAEFVIIKLAQLAGQPQS